MGNEYTPDVWVAIKIKRKKLYKILAGWYGGYTGADQWRINSGITKMTEDKDNFYFHGSTGSVYTCRKQAERMSALTASIFAQIKSKVMLVPSNKLPKVFE